MVLSTSKVSQVTTVVGNSTMFALTDIATASMMNDLYNIPAGLKVRHGSNQAVVEFYGEVFQHSSMSDVEMLCSLSQYYVVVLQ